MLKKLTGFFIIIVMLLMLLSSNALARDTILGNIGEVITSGYYNQGFFCMNYTLHRHEGRYVIYEGGSIKDLELHAANHMGLNNAGDNGQLISFIIGDMQKESEVNSSLNGGNARDGQPWADWIWYLLDDVRAGELNTMEFTSKFSELESKYYAYKEIYDMATPSAVTISAPNSIVMVPDANKIVGPFNVTYPYTENTNKFDDQINLKITATSAEGNSIILYDKANSINLLKKSDGTTPFAIGDTEFYFSLENSGLTLGKRYSFKIDWDFEYYDIGKYVKLAPERELRIEYNCPKCGIINSSLCGYYVPYNWVYSNEVWDSGHVYQESNGQLIHVDSPWAPGHNIYINYMEIKDKNGNWRSFDPDDGSRYDWQNFIYLQTTNKTKNLSAEVEDILIGQPNIVLEFNKISSLTTRQLAGVIFEVAVENGSVVVGNTLQNPYSFTTEDESNFVEVKPDNSIGFVEKIVIKFTETKTLDDYIIYKEPLVITFKWNQENSTWEIESITTPENEEEVTNINGTSLGEDANSWTITAKNRPKIDLSGFVWIDEPQGNKKIDPPNGIFDNGETKKSGVEVYLYKNDGTWVKEDGYGELYGEEGYLVTDANGKYKFENVPKLPDGEAYYILFKYDGINYIRTVDGQSKATERDRVAFNADFKTISAGQANGANGAIPLEYNYDANNKISTLITEDENGKVLEEFAISADTLNTTYNVTTENIDLGLRKKVLDLSLMTDLYKAEASINGVPVNYTYNEEFDASGTINSIIDISQDITAGKQNYTMDLYRSDYNYRIGDYNLNGAHGPSLDPTENAALLNSREELTVLLDYVILLNNQSTVEAQIEEFEYYYDSHLKPLNITGGQANDIGGKLIITPDVKNLGYGEQTRITITFSYNVASTDQQPTITNYGEITKYSTTEGGYVDCDSAPGNAFEGAAFKYEDDADQANGLKINIARSEREISGYVYEDNKTEADPYSGYTIGNGKYDEGETRVNDVIVQLIEVKTLEIGGTTHRLEYIWQETITGSNVVKKVSADGTKLETYTVPAEEGKYTFNSFIPGTYIVRFIYGDGTYYDSALDGNNITKYNGLDYKSTFDKCYLVDWLNIGEGSYSEHDSMARDIESRRLELMKFVLTEDPSKSEVNKENLKNIWMAADTSKLGVSDTILEQNKSVYVKKGIDFGLVKRPQTSLALTKHITYVKLKGQGVDISASIDNYNSYNEETTEIMHAIQKSSENGGALTAQSTTYKNRGYWQIESNNVDGADLTIKYQYNVKNVGEPDYVSSVLANKLNETDGYSKYLNAIEDRIDVVNKAIKSGNYKIADSYLGKAYYTGIKDDEYDREVGTYVQLEDYLSKDLAIGDGSEFTKIADSEEKTIINKESNEAKEFVRVIRTEADEIVTSSASANYELILTKTLSASDNLEFPSYIAQVVAPTVNLAGTRIIGTTPGNAKYVQSYAKTATLDNLEMEKDEYWAETFKIVPTTGEDKQSSLALTISIASGLAVIVVGIILIRKFIIK